MIIIGIDPGIVNIGYCIVKSTNKKQEVLLQGCLVSKHDRCEDKLISIHSFFSDMVAKYSPSLLVYEEPTNIRGENGATINQALGIIKVLCKLRNSQVELRSAKPTQLKKSATGNGRATKKDIEIYVQKYFNLPKLPETDHAADALNCVAWWLKREI